MEREGGIGGSAVLALAALTVGTTTAAAAVQEPAGGLLGEPLDPGACRVEVTTLAAAGEDAPLEGTVAVRGRHFAFVRARGWDRELVHDGEVVLETEQNLGLLTLSPDGERVACLAWSSPDTDYEVLLDGEPVHRFESRDEAFALVQADLRTRSDDSGFPLRFSPDSRRLWFPIHRSSGAVLKIVPDGAEIALGQLGAMAVHGGEGLESMVAFSADGSAVAVRSVDPQGQPLALLLRAGEGLRHVPGPTGYLGFDAASADLWQFGTTGLHGGDLVVLRNGERVRGWPADKGWRAWPRRAAGPPALYLGARSATVVDGRREYGLRGQPLEPRPGGLDARHLPGGGLALPCAVLRPGAREPRVFWTVDGQAGPPLASLGELGLGADGAHHAYLGTSTLAAAREAPGFDRIVVDGRELTDDHFAGGRLVGFRPPVADGHHVPRTLAAPRPLASPPAFSADGRAFASASAPERRSDGSSVGGGLWIAAVDAPDEETLVGGLDPSSPLFTHGGRHVVFWSRDPASPEHRPAFLPTVDGRPIGGEAFDGFLGQPSSFRWVASQVAEAIAVRAEPSGGAVSFFRVRVELPDDLEAGELDVTSTEPGPDAATAREAAAELPTLGGAAANAAATADAPGLPRGVVVLHHALSPLAVVVPSMGRARTSGSARSRHTAASILYDARRDPVSGLPADQRSRYVLDGDRVLELTDDGELREFGRVTEELVREGLHGDLRAYEYQELKARHEGANRQLFDRLVQAGYRREHLDRLCAFERSFWFEQDAIRAGDGALLLSRATEARELRAYLWLSGAEPVALGAKLSSSRIPDVAGLAGADELGRVQPVHWADAGGLYAWAAEPGKVQRSGGRFERTPATVHLLTLAPGRPLALRRLSLPPGAWERFEQTADGFPVFPEVTGARQPDQHRHVPLAIGPTGAIAHPAKGWLAGGVIVKSGPLRSEYDHFARCGLTPSGELEVSILRVNGAGAHEVLPTTRFAPALRDSSPFVDRLYELAAGTEQAVFGDGLQFRVVDAGERILAHVPPRSSASRGAGGMMESLHVPTGASTLDAAFAGIELHLMLGTARFGTPREAEGTAALYAPITGHGQAPTYSFLDCERIAGSDLTVGRPEDWAALGVHTVWHVLHRGASGTWFAARSVPEPGEAVVDGAVLPAAHTLCFVPDAVAEDLVAERIAQAREG